MFRRSPRVRMEAVIQFTLAVESMVPQVCWGCALRRRPWAWIPIHLFVEVACIAFQAADVVGAPKECAAGVADETVFVLLQGG